MGTAFAVGDGVAELSYSGSGIYLSDSFLQLGRVPDEEVEDGSQRDGRRVCSGEDLLAISIPVGDDGDASGKPTFVERATMTSVMLILSGSRDLSAAQRESMSSPTQPSFISKWPSEEVFERRFIAW